MILGLKEGCAGLFLEPQILLLFHWPSVSLKTNQNEEFSIALLFAFAISCSKDEESKGAFYVGSYPLTCNGNSWNGNVINTSLIGDLDTLSGTFQVHLVTDPSFLGTKPENPDLTCVDCCETPSKR